MQAGVSLLHAVRSVKLYNHIGALLITLHECKMFAISDYNDIMFIAHFPVSESSRLFQLIVNFDIVLMS